MREGRGKEVGKEKKKKKTKKKKKDKNKKILKYNLNINFLGYLIIVRGFVHFVTLAVIERRDRLA